jgi:hypothetical protein
LILKNSGYTLSLIAQYRWGIILTLCWGIIMTLDSISPIFDSFNAIIIHKDKLKLLEMKNGFTMSEREFSDLNNLKNHINNSEQYIIYKYYMSDKYLAQLIKLMIETDTSFWLAKG